MLASALMIKKEKHGWFSSDSCITLRVLAKYNSDNFDLEGDCVTLEGFLKLHEMALEDEDGGEEEIRETLTSMGYNEALLLVKVTS